jgi:hypothetical protein
MKKYYYLLDEHKRIYFISETFTTDYDNLKEIELEIDISEIQILNHGIVDNKLVLIGPTEEEILEMKKGFNLGIIVGLKTNLLETDYRVIKCYEASLLNEEMPYNLQELLAQRKAWRDEINALEFEISMLG